MAFDAGGGDIICTQSVKSKECATPPPQPHLDGHRFAGWYKDPFFNHPFDFNTPITSNITLFGQFIEVYLVIFETFCQAEIKPQVVDKDNKAICPPELRRNDGYVFIGWFCDEACTSPFDFDSFITKDITLYAGWQREYYFLSFDSCGGTEIPAQKVRFDQITYKPSDPTKENKKFGGWFWDKDYLYKFEFGNYLTSDITIYACWLDIKPQIYQLVFYDFYPHIFLVQYLEQESLINSPKDIPEKEGYKFVGWFADSDCNIPFEFGQPIFKDTKVYAKFLEQKEVRFFDGDRIICTQYVYEGEKVMPPLPPQKEGYVFDNWYNDSDLTSVFDFDLEINQDLDVFAGYIKLAKYQFYDGETLLFEGQTTKNSKINKPPDAEKDGYVFFGWFCDSDLTKEFDFTLPIQEDIKIYAGLKKVSVSFYVDIDDISKTFCYEQGSLFDQSPPQKEGYNFIGWFLDSGYKNPFDKT